MQSNIITNLTKLEALLRDGGEEKFANRISMILLESDHEIWKFLISDEFWGGSGSIVDQALTNHRELRRELEKILIELGGLQLEKGQVNTRTDYWTSTFKLWKQQGI